MLAHAKESASTAVAAEEEENEKNLKQLLKEVDLTGFCDSYDEGENEYIEQGARDATKKLTSAKRNAINWKGPRNLCWEG